MYVLQHSYNTHDIYVHTCQDTTITIMSVSILTLADTITGVDSKFCKAHVNATNILSKD